jgi:hypothetical protein
VKRKGVAARRDLKEAWRRWAADSPYAIANFEFEQVLLYRRTWNNR